VSKDTGDLTQNSGFTVPDVWLLGTALAAPAPLPSLTRTPLPSHTHPRRVTWCPRTRATWRRPQASRCACAACCVTAWLCGVLRVLLCGWLWAVSRVLLGAAADRLLQTGCRRQAECLTACRVQGA